MAASSPATTIITIHLLLMCLCLQMATTDQIDVKMNISMENSSFVNVSAVVDNLNVAGARNPELALLQGASVNSVSDSSVTGQVFAVACPVGSYIDPTTQACTQCPVGTYSSTTGAMLPSTCTDCTSGYYSNVLGASSVDVCNQCPAGTYGPKSRAGNISDCLSCPSGTMSPIGSQLNTSCLCISGFYRPFLSGSCSVCPVGSYCESGTSIQTCPMGQGAGEYATSPQGSISINQCKCKPGYTGLPYTINERCSTCPANFFCPGTSSSFSGVTDVIPCPTNSISNPGATSINDCQCASSFRQTTSNPATRRFSVLSTPCNCSNGDYACPKSDGTTCTTGCSSSDACTSGSTLTCKQGYLNLNINNYAYDSSSTYTWIIAPEDTRQIVLAITRFKTPTSSTSKLQFYGCTESTCTGSLPLLGELSTNLQASTSAYVYTSNLNVGIMKLVWTSDSAIIPTGQGFGWSTSYSTTPKACNPNVLSFGLTSVNYFNSGSMDSSPAQPSDNWPLVVWVGDILYFNNPAGSIKINMKTTSASGVAVSQVGTGMWQVPQDSNTYTLVDAATPSRTRSMIIKPSEFVTIAVTYNVIGSSNFVFSLMGDITGNDSPPIVLVAGDILIMSRNTDTFGVAIKDSAGLLVSGVLGQSTSSVRYASLTWNSAGVAPGIFYYAGISAEGITVKSGTIWVTDRPIGVQCVQCVAGEYCFNGSPNSCPSNSMSAPGASAVSECLCNLGYAAETTDVSSYVNGQAVDSGGRHSCVATHNFELYCWGANEKGQLGIGKTSVSEPPTKAYISNVRSVSLGDDFTCVIYGDPGQVKCWGGNYYGQLGIDSAITDTGDSLPDPTLPGAPSSTCATCPVGKTSLIENAKLSGAILTSYSALQMACGGSTCCAVVVRNPGSLTALTCWGRGSSGQLGNNGINGVADQYKLLNIGTGNSLTGDRQSYYLTGSPQSVVPLGSDLPTRVTMGGTHACAITTSGAVDGFVWCWGYSSSGALGLADNRLSPTQNHGPVKIDLGTGVYAKTVDCYKDVCCVVTATKFNVKCWGKGLEGRIGTGRYNVGIDTGSMGNNLQSVQLGKSVVAMDVNVGSTQVCALLGNNHVKCWGLIASVIVGTNPITQMSELLPDLAMQAGRVALQIAGKGGTVCAVLSDYRVVCWGNNDYKQLGAPLAGTVGARRLFGMPESGTDAASRQLLGSRYGFNQPPPQNSHLHAGRSLLQVKIIENGQIPINQTNMTLVNLPTGIIAARATGTPSVLSCAMCPENSFCNGFGGAATSCPANTSSPAMTTNLNLCLCNKGLAGYGNTPCTQCTGTQYCINGMATTCPDYSTTLAPKAYQKFDCKCIPGYTGANGSQCLPCSQGLFKDSYGDAACTACPAGTYNGKQGINSTDGCLPCPGGKYSDAGAMSCTGCNAGDISTPRSASCKACAHGFYTSANSDTCISCPLGTYDSLVNSGDVGTCVACIPGTFSNAVNATSSSTCKRCSAGTSSPTGVSQCTPCAPGFYSDEGVETCTQCPANSTSLQGSIYSQCTCAAGFFKDFFANPSTFQCTACPSGSWSAANASKCTLCNPGMAQPNTASSQCSACLAGTYAPLGSPICYDCPFWSFSSANAGQCTNCSIGEYAASKSTSCTPCGATTYATAPIAASSSCQPCPAGYFCPGQKDATNGYLRDCPIGTFSDNTGYSAIGQCGACPQNNYCPRPTIKSPCPTGTGSASGSSSQLQCTCRPGFVCSYKKVVNAVVTLQMTATEFENQAVKTAFINAVAAASMTTPDKVMIISYAARAGRRLLSLRAPLELRGEGGGNHAMQNSGATGATHDVYLEISDTAVGLEDIDRHLAGAGFTAVDLAWCSPHSVDVQPVRH